MRKPLSENIEAEVLIKSRRRCCLCFGLDNNHDIISQGQIAHLDHNNANNKEDNLAFLCLRHHAIYDTRSYQSKNLTQSEVKKYRCDLYRFNKNLFDLDEVQKIFIFALNNKIPITFHAIRRYVYVMNCSETRPAETQHQISELVKIGALVKNNANEYYVNMKLFDEMIEL